MLLDNFYRAKQFRNINLISGIKVKINLLYGSVDIDFANNQRIVAPPAPLQNYRRLVWAWQGLCQVIDYNCTLVLQWFAQDGNVLLLNPIDSTCGIYHRFHGMTEPYFKWWTILVSTRALYHIVIYQLYRYFGYTIHIVSFILVTRYLKQYIFT